MTADKNPDTFFSQVNAPDTNMIVRAFSPFGGLRPIINVF